MSDVANRTHMRQLDGLRAFAIFFTMLTHFIDLTGSWIVPFIPKGQLGVRPFFVISGFLITRILLRCRLEKDRWGELRVFYCRRLLRIVPLYYATLAFAALVNVRPVRQTLWWHVAYLTNVYQVVQHAAPHSVVTHLWSLSVEEQFYLFWPCLILFLPRRYLLNAMIATVCLGPLSRLIGVTLQIPSFGALPFSCMDALGIGAIMAYCQDKQLGSAGAAARFTKTMKWLGIPSFGLFLVAKIAGIAVPGAPVLADLSAAFAFGWLVSRAASSFKGPFGKLLELRPIRYIGRISYGIYMLHAFMPVGLFYLAKWSHLSPPEDSWWKFLVVIAMSVSAASVSFHFFESPINAYKRYFEYARARRKPEVRVAQAEYAEAFAG